MANIFEPVKIQKIEKVCLRTYYIAGHLECRGFGSLALDLETLRKVSKELQ